MNTFYCFFLFDSGQHVEIQLMCSCILYSRVVNKLTLYQCCSIALDLMLDNMLRVERIRSIILDLILVNMLRFNEQILLCLTR